MNVLLRKKSLQRNIILLTLTLTIFIAVIFSVFYYQTKSYDMEKNLSRYSDTLTFQVNQYFNERLHTIVTRVYTLTSSERYINTFSEYLTSDFPYQYQLTLSIFNSLISEIKIPDSFVGSVYLYTPKGTFYDLSTISHTNEDFLKSTLYAEYKSSGSPVIYYGYQVPDTVFNSDHSVIPVVIKTPIPGYLGDVFLIININSAAVDNYLARSAFTDGDVMLVNSRKQIISSSNIGMTETYLSLFSIEGDSVIWSKGDYIVSSNKLDINDWFVITFTNKAVVAEMIKSGVFLVLLMQLLSIIITFLCAAFFSGRIVKPLQNLQYYMRRFTEGDYSIQYNYDYDNEVGRLTRVFNYMVQRIGDLVGELNGTIEQLRVEKENVRQEQLLKRTAELNALQAQINPHFLYNTLNSIIWLASEGETDKICTLAASLSNFYEYRIRCGQTLVPIRDEIEQIRNYIAIQNIRYCGKIHCYFHLDEALLDKPVIKLILQPLVENSIIHGLQCKDGATDIHVSVCKDDATQEGDILIKVEDNGIGIPQDKLRIMNEYLSTGKIPDSSYGIYNVNMRIKLYLGNRFGLWYESEMGVGTTAYIRISSQTTDCQSRKEETNVQSYDC